MVLLEVSASGMHLTPLWLQVALYLSVTNSFFFNPKKEFWCKGAFGVGEISWLNPRVASLTG